MFIGRYCRIAGDIPPDIPMPYRVRLMAQISPEKPIRSSGRSDSDSARTCQRKTPAIRSPKSARPAIDTGHCQRMA